VFWQSQGIIFLIIFIKKPIFRNGIPFLAVKSPPSKTFHKRIRGAAVPPLANNALFSQIVFIFMFKNQLT
jgi:hypothetical protein